MLDPILESATNVLGGRRFYPPGAHPATASYRKALRQLLDRGADDRNETVAYIKDVLARFEEGESRAKQDYLRRRGR